MNVPEDLKYTKEHEWVRVDGDRLIVGITDFAQDALGDVVYVDVPETGTQVKGGEPFGEVESTKSVSDVYVPVSVGHPLNTPPWEKVNPGGGVPDATVHT